MDGTLLGSDGKVSAESAEIISRLSRNGVLISVATARTPATVEVLLADTYTAVPAIVMTGAAMWDRQAKRYINPVLHTPEALPGLVGEFHRMGVNPFIYVLGDDGMLRVYHNGGMNRDELKFYEERRNLEFKKFILDSDEGRQGIIPGTILVFGLGDGEIIEGIAERLKGDSRLSVSCYRDNLDRDMAYIEVFGSDVSKSSAVRRLVEMLGADKLTVYGDNLNDLSMLAEADDAVAVANAVPEVLAKASRHIGANTASSVAKDMERIVRSGEGAFQLLTGYFSVCLSTNSY